MSIRRMMLFTLGARIKSLIKAFKDRVLGNSGQFEAEACLEAQLNDLNDNNLLDSASLIITPTAYNENFLYSVTPAEVGTNLFSYSDTFNASYWYKFNGVLTPDDAIAPDGTPTADLFTKTAAVNTTTNVSRTTTPYLNTGIHTFSIYAKPKVGETMSVRMDRDGSTAIFTFNFTTKTFTNSGVNVVSSTYEELPDGWFRIICTANATSLWKIDACLLFSNPTDDAMWIWGAQLEEGETAGVYIPTYINPVINGTVCDFEFTRSTVAYRINKDGLVEPSPYNLFSYSEDFTNSLWSKNNLTITGNQAIAPDGHMTADLYVPNTTFGEHQFNQALTSTPIWTLVTPTNEYNWTIYAKYAGNDYFLLRARMGGIWSQNTYNLTNGTVVASPNFINADIEDVGDGWYRLSCTFTNVDSPNTMQFVSTPTGSAGFTGDDVSGAYIWGAQLSIGPNKLDYFPTTNRFNVPRINHPYGECPVILSEPQMTNNWTNNNNSTGYLSGGSSANIINNGTVYSAFGYGFNGFDYSFTGGATFLGSLYNIKTTNTLSIPVQRVCLFIKNPSSDFFGINHGGGAGQCFYQFSTLTAQNYYDPATENGKIVKINDDTYALYVWSDTAPGLQFGQIRIGFVTSLTNQNTVDGTAIIGLGFWQGSTTTPNMQNHSYTPIVTTTAAVTRNAENLFSFNGYNLIGQNEGTVFLDFDKTYTTGGIKTLLSMNTLINDETLYIQTSNNGVNLFVSIVSTSNSVSVQRIFTIPDGKNKLAVVYSTSGTKIFLNGTQLDPLTNTALPAMDIIYLGNRQGGRNYGNVREFVLWKTQITDEQAINLTTL